MNERVILDIETNGISFNKGAEITEIGAQIVDKNYNKIGDPFNTLLKINGIIPDFNIYLNGITKRMTEELGQNPIIVMNDLKKYIGNRTIYAHYAKFDKSFIEGYFKMFNINVDLRWIDTISIFKNKWPHRRKYSLESLIIDNKLSSKEDHRALSDINHTIKLLKM